MATASTSTRTPSKYGVNVDLDAKPGFVIVSQFERISDDEKEVIATREFDVASVHADLASKVASYGLSKILQDRTSAESKDASRLDSMDAVMARLAEGQWEKERESSGPTISAEVEALAELRGVGAAVIQKALRAYTPEQREKILANETVVAKAEEIRARRATQADTDLGLEEFAA